MMRFITLMLVGLLVLVKNQGTNAENQCYNDRRNNGASSLCSNCENAGYYCCSAPEWGGGYTPCDGHAAYMCCGCFPALAKVQHSDGHVMKMTELQVGNSILTVDSNGDIMPTEVIAFMKQQHSVHSVYRHIKTDNGNEVAMTPDHLILSALQSNSQDFNIRFAKDVEVGDLVKIADGEASIKISKVVDVRMSVLKGAYVPLTKEGTVLVDMILSSCYAGIDHDVAHFFVTPLRWFPGLLGAHLNTDGSNTYVDLVRDIGKWVMPGSQQSKQNRIWNYVASCLQLDTAFY